MCNGCGLLNDPFIMCKELKQSLLMLQVCNPRKKKNESNALCTSHTSNESDQDQIDCCRKVKFEQTDELPSISSNVEWGQASVPDTASRSGSSSNQASSTRSLNPSSRFLSRFSFIPGNVSFRLSRATSLGSSRSYPLPSTGLTILNSEEEVQLHTGSASGLINRDESQQGNSLLAASLSSQRPRLCCEDTSANLQLNNPGSGFSYNFGDNQTNSSTQDVARSGDCTRMGMDLNFCSPRAHTDMESTGTRLSDRHLGSREPVQRNVRFSRTLSVGRLRDRVLRRSSLSDFTSCPLQQAGEVRDTNQGSGTQAWGDETRTLTSEGNAVSSPNAYPPSSMSGSLFGIQDYEVETSHSREARYHDLLEHRSNFLERRRRIRSQVCICLHYVAD